MERVDWLKLILEFVKAVLLVLAGGAGMMTLFG